MAKKEIHPVIKMADTDNVAVVINSSGLEEGSHIEGNIRLVENIPMGHKVAIVAIGKGQRIIRYGHTIGFARQDLLPGERVREDKIEIPDSPVLENVILPKNAMKSDVEPLDGYTFMGYRNKDGSVGTKNILALATSVHCVAGFAQHAVEKIKNELLPKYPNVDDIVALNHTYGCGVAINAPAAVVPKRSLQNIAKNPNFGAEVLVIGLGCEKLQPENLVQGSNNLFIMQDESVKGFEAMVDRVMKLAEIHLKKLNTRKREVCPASELVVGMQCGGSDAFSGITSNPVAGFAADLIVKAGGSVMFSEVTEVRDAIQALVNRAINPEVGKALIAEMQWYDDYLKKGEADRTANTSPGNKEGGLSNIVEKALGSLAKSGKSPIVDVLGFGERIRKKGLTFAATPANDFVCGTLQMASGMNIHVFMTGRGTPYGLAAVPVIKVGSNSKLSKRWFDLIDLDAGEIAFGRKTIEEMGWELFRLILDVASGKKQTACDRLGLHNDLVLFNPGPLT